MRFNYILLLILFCSGLGMQTMQAITLDEIQFCMNKELWGILKDNQVEIEQYTMQNPNNELLLNTLLKLAEKDGDSLKIIAVMQKKVQNKQDWDTISELINIYHNSSPALQKQCRLILKDLRSKNYNRRIDRETFDFLMYAKTSKTPLLRRYKHYNSIMEDWCKEMIDEIAVETSDSVREAGCRKFLQDCGNSKWSDAAYYYLLYSLKRQQKYRELLAEINLIQVKRTELAYQLMVVGYLLDPEFRNHPMNRTGKDSFLLQASIVVENLIKEIKKSDQPTYKYLYSNWDKSYTLSRLYLTLAKVNYYNIFAVKNLESREDSLDVFPFSDEDISYLESLLSACSFPNNDNGEQAELAFWFGKVYRLSKNPKLLKSSAESFLDCLILGAPRKRFDKTAEMYFNKLHQYLQIEKSPEEWGRELKKYQGPVFRDITEHAGLNNLGASRIAMGDINNDNLPDLLLNGSRLFKNKGDRKFEEITQSAGLTSSQANGGIFADFNHDGLLDFAAISSAMEGKGEELYKNQGSEKFVVVNERAGDINDRMPTEGAAWVDTGMTGYPDLYFANYESWGVRDGYPDVYFENREGYFYNRSKQIGILTPSYTHDNGQAGRGVAPCDYDNDGEQEILVTNYRLDRNFLWKWVTDHYEDVAALDGVAGVNKKGFYGHSIGGAWADYDLDGDQDLFIANLAHPRYIDISDISMLLRNDGKRQTVIGNKPVTYTEFTNVTANAGIKFDELHSDPNWFDADNDGDMDLFITSIYENERSYLYLNNGNGTFIDVTWLSGCRSYNGWGNAVGDIDLDGRMDLCVGSSSGLKLFHNITANAFRSATFMVNWHKEKAVLSLLSTKTDSLSTPCFGAKVRLVSTDYFNVEHSQIMELSSAKGTTSQNWQMLHFGIKDRRLLRAELYIKNKVVQTLHF